MRKIIIICFICILSVCNILTVSANSEIDKLIDDNKYMFEITNEDSNAVTREMGIVYILKILGITDEIADLSNNTYIFNDVDATRPASRYIGYAYKMKFVLGTGIDKIEPLEKLTYEQMAAIIMRSISKKDCGNSDINDLYYKAVEYGVILESDYFFLKRTEYISKDDFDILLCRLGERMNYKYKYDDTMLYNISDEKLRQYKNFKYNFTMSILENMNVVQSENKLTIQNYLGYTVDIYTKDNVEDLNKLLYQEYSKYKELYSEYLCEAVGVKDKVYSDKTFCELSYKITRFNDNYAVIAAIYDNDKIYIISIRPQFTVYSYKNLFDQDNVNKLEDILLNSLTIMNFSN